MPEQTEAQVPLASAVSADDETGLLTSNVTVDSADTPLFGPPAAEGEIGRLGKYRIRKQLGQGGMGAVYLAFDEKLQRQVALKVMLPKAAANASAKERFLREARAAAQISSDHVVAIYEADEIDGTPYIALQYLQGSPLDQYLRDKGNLPMAHVLRVVRETAEGLAAAHRLGLIHRDIKPANLWLEAPKGRVKILDFGLARQEREDVQLTQSGAIVGTPTYMSPEQARGKALDGRSDLFSLGAVLYRLLTGDVPFKGDTTMAVLMALGTEEPTPVQQRNPAVPPALADLTHRLLAKNPDQRPKDAATLVKLVQEIEAGKSTTNAPPVPIVETMPLAVSVQTENVWAGLDDEDGGSAVPAPEAAAPPPVKPKPERLPPKKKKVPIALIGSLVLGVLTLVVAGVIIIKLKNKDGTETEIKVPEGTTVTIIKDGKDVAKVGPDAKPAEPWRPAAPWQGIPVGESPFDKLDAKEIPATERFEWQPKELVGVIGSHARRHWDGVQSIAISSDGRFACTGPTATALAESIVWDVETQQPIARFKGWHHPYFSDDGKTLYLLGSIKSFTVDLTQRPLKLTPSNATVPIEGEWRDLRLIEKGRTLIGCNYGGGPAARGSWIAVDVSGEKPVVGGTLEVWIDFNYPRFQVTSQGQAFYQDKQGKLRRVEIKNAKFVNDRELPIAADRLCALSDDGKKLAVWADKQLQVWDLSATPPRIVHRLPEQEGLRGDAIFCLSPDGTWLTAKYSYAALFRLDAEQPKRLAWLDQTDVAGTYGVIAFSADSRKVILGNANGLVRFWDLAGPEPKELSPFDPATAFPHANWHWSISLDARQGRILLPRYDAPEGKLQRFQLWNLTGTRPAPAAFLDTPFWGPVHALGQDRFVQIPPSNGQPSQLYRVKDAGFEPAGEPFGSINNFGNVSPDGRHLVLYPREKLKQLEGWDLSTDPPQQKWQIEPKDQMPVDGNTFRVWFSADNRWFATQAKGEKEGGPWKLVLWRNDGPKPVVHTVLPIELHPALYRAAFSPDGRYLAHTPKGSSEIVLHDLTGKEPREVARYTSDNVKIGACLSLAFHLDGKKLAVGSDRGVGILDVATMKPIWDWQSPGPIHWLDWAADGRHLVTHNGNLTVYVLRMPESVVGKVPAAPPERKPTE